MKRLVLIPLLFMCAFGFSQRVDTLLGYKGKLKIDTAITIDGNYLFTPSQNHISFDSTKIPWRPNGSKIYYTNGYVGIGSSNPRARLFIADSTIVGSTVTDSSGIALVNDTGYVSPTLLISSRGGISLVPYKFRIVTVGNGTGSNFYIQRAINNAAYVNIFVMDYNGNITTTGNATFNGANSAMSTSLVVPQLYSNFFLSGGSVGATPNISLVSSFGPSSGTFYGAGVTVSTQIAATGGTNTYTGFYFNPTSQKLYGTRLYGFRNSVGNNGFNESGGGSGFGVASTDTLNGSAKVEIKDTTKGFLLPRMTKAQRNKIISSITGTITAGSSGGYTVTSNVVMNGGSGSGAIATIVVNTGFGVVSCVFNSLGSGYVAGDVLTATGFTGFSYTISAVGLPATGLAIYQTDNTPGLRVFNGTNWMRYTETTD